DGHVTGVQTCALPICCLAVMTVTFAATASNVSFFLMNGFGVPVTYLVTDDTGSETLVQLGPNFSGGGTTVTLPSREIRQVLIRRSEERRVGKEWRSGV